MTIVFIGAYRPLLCPFFPVLLQHGARSDLLLAPAVAAFLLGLLLDVLVLTLLFLADAPQVLLLGHLNLLSSAGLADRLDQIPLAHFRAAGDVLVLGDLVQLLAIAILERAAGFPPALTASSRLLAELAAGALREPRDRALPPRGLLCLPDISLRGLYLARRSHSTHLHRFALWDLYP